MTPNLEISTVVGCRMGCDYCPQKVHTHTYLQRVLPWPKGSINNHMALDDFKTMLSTVPKSVEIIFAGMAEPWLNPNATDMVIYATSQGYKVGAYTTLVGMTMEDITRLQSVNFKFICLHLPDADGLMKLKVTDQYLSTILLFLSKFPYAQKMVIGKLHPEVEEITGPVIDGSPGLFSRAGNLKTLAINKKRGKLQCSACGPKIDHNVLLPNGDVLLCCMDYAQEHVIGNLLTMGYDGLFKSEEYLKVMRGLEDENSNIACRQCEVSVNV